MLLAKKEAYFWNPICPLILWLFSTYEMAELGNSFIQYFYQCFDQDRNSLQGLYVCSVLSSVIDRETAPC